MAKTIKNPNRCSTCGCYFSDHKQHICKPNPMTGKKHSKKTKELIGAKSKNRNWATGERNGSYTYGKIELRKQLRGLGEYKKWRKDVIKAFEDEGGIYKKGMQTHHFKPFGQIIIENNITTIEEARECEELWDVSNGVVLKKGEHFILSQLERMKYHSKDFFKMLRIWIESREENAIDLD